MNMRELAAKLTARVNAELGAAAVPGSGAARRIEARRAITKQMEREGLFEFRRDGSGISLHTLGPEGAAMKRWHELIEAAGPLRRRLTAYPAQHQFPVRQCAREAETIAPNASSRTALR